jgi:hypothetical protein
MKVLLEHTYIQFHFTNPSKPLGFGYETSPLSLHQSMDIHIQHLTLSDPMSDLVQHYDFPVPDAFPHVVLTLANK